VALATTRCKVAVLWTVITANVSERFARKVLVILSARITYAVHGLWMTAVLRSGGEAEGKL
jgi:hypothetical protein